MSQTVSTGAVLETRHATPAPAYDLARVRADFPILSREVHGRPLVYLDNAASTQKPLAVVDAIVGCYTGYYANVERGVHTLSQLSTEARERARETVRRFLKHRGAVAGALCWLAAPSGVSSDWRVSSNKSNCPYATANSNHIGHGAMPGCVA